jgi:hypothetical protein
MEANTVKNRMMCLCSELNIGSRREAVSLGPALWRS